MIRHLFLPVALFGALLIASPAHSQVFTMGGSGGSGPSYFLLMNKRVQSELKLSEEQNKKIQAKIQESMPQGGMVRFGGDGKGGDAKAGDGPKISFSVVGPKNGAAPPGGVVIGGGEGGNFKLPALPDFKKIDEEILKLLDEKQQARLKQLNLQQQGLTALAQDKVATEVGLQDEQRDLIKQILTENRKKTMELVQQLRGDGGPFDPQAFGEHMKKQRETTEKDIGLLLTDEQKEKWSQMTGPKFDFGFGGK